MTPRTAEIASRNQIAPLQFGGQELAPEKVFDDLTWLATQICCAPVAILSVAGGRGQRVKSKIGLTAREAAREFAFCDEALAQKRLLTVTDAAQDILLAHDPGIAASSIRFVACLPLVRLDGTALGTLTVMDRVPRELTREQVYALEILGRQIVQQLELRSRFGNRHE